MTTITANLAVAGTNASFTGYIRVNIASSFADSLGTLNLPVSRDFPLTNGATSFDLTPSDVSKIAYNFEIWQTVSGSPDSLIKAFSAVVPYSATSISITSLATQAGVRYDAKDAALLTLARYLQSSDTFWQALVQNVWNLKGSWINSNYYKRGDVVTYNGSAYQYIQAVASTGTVPTNTSNWRLLVAKGDTGTGTSGNDSAYDPSWSGQTDAPSRNTVYNIIQTLATTASLGNKANSVDAVLTGNPTAPTQANANNSTRIATTAYVQNNLAFLGQVPVGALIDWVNTSAPTGWLLCNGRTVSRTTYSGLFTIVGTTYGNGDGTTTFNIPNISGNKIIYAGV